MLEAARRRRGKGRRPVSGRNFVRALCDVVRPEGVHGHHARRMGEVVAGAANDENAGRAALAQRRDARDQRRDRLLVRRDQGLQIVTV